MSARPRRNPAQVPLTPDVAAYEGLMRSALTDAVARALAFRARAPYARRDADTWPKTARFLAATFRDSIAIYFMYIVEKELRAHGPDGGDYVVNGGRIGQVASLCEEVVVEFEERLARIVKDESREEVLHSRIFWNAANEGNASRSKKIDTAIARCVQGVESLKQQEMYTPASFALRQVVEDILLAMGRPKAEAQAVRQAVVFVGRGGSRRAGDVAITGYFVSSRHFKLGKFKPTSKKDL